MQEFDISFAVNWPWWLIAGVTALGLVAVALFYRRAARVVSRRYLLLLAALRAVALMALFLCLFRPVIQYRRGVIERSQLLIMADTSRSMSMTDPPGQEARLDRVKRALLAHEGGMSAVVRGFNVQWFTFDEHAVPLRERNAVAALAADGQATDITTGVKDALGGTDRSLLAGVVVFTDGIDTAGDPVGGIKDLGVPIYAVGVGSILGAQENLRDIMIARVEAKREVTVDLVSPIEIDVEAMGYPDRVVPVVLLEDGREAARETVVLDNVRGVQKVTLRYVPQGTGDFQLTVRIPPDPSEQVADNNERTLPVFVTDPKIRVLYLEGVARSEYKYLREALQYDPNVEALSLVQLGPNYFYQQGNLADVQLDGPPKTFEELKQFKVLIIGSLDSAAFSDEQMRFIERFVKEGGGLMMLGGMNSFGPGGYGGTPVEYAMPVVCGPRDIGQERDAFHLHLTDAGRRHPVFAGIARFFEPNADPPLPQLLGCTRVKSAKQTAEVLAIHPDSGNLAGSLVAVAAIHYGSGKSLAATIDTTHLWYIPLKGMGKESPYVRYWGQAIRWLAGDDDEAGTSAPGVTAYTDRHFYDPGGEPRIRAFVTDKEGQTTDKARVEAQIAREGGRKVQTVQLSLVPDTRNEYETVLGPQESGRYAVAVRASLDGESLGEAALTFRVGDPTREFERRDLDANTLRKIADATGGLYLPLLSLDQLADVLRARSEERIERREIFLWNTPILFVAFLLLVTSEWILRKRRLLA